MTQDFPRSRRLLRAGDFAAVFRHARRSSDRYFTVLATLGRDTDSPRLGLAVARKHVRLAVARNRLKRLAREAFRTEADQLGPIDIVVMARPAAALASNSEVSGSLRMHFRRLAEKPRRKPQAITGKTG